MPALALPRRLGAPRFTQAASLVLPVAVAALAASAAYAGADTTFAPALTKFTDFLEGSGGKIITVLSLAGGLIGLASGRFTLSQIAAPVGGGSGAARAGPISIPSSPPSS